MEHIYIVVSGYASITNGRGYVSPATKGTSISLLRDAVLGWPISYLVRLFCLFHFLFSYLFTFFIFRKNMHISNLLYLNFRSVHRTFLKMFMQCENNIRTTSKKG